MLLVVLNTPQARRRFDKRCKGEIGIYHTQILEKISTGVYLVDESPHTLRLILQEYTRDKKITVYKIQDQIHEKELIDMFIRAP